MYPRKQTVLVPPAASEAVPHEHRQKGISSTDNFHAASGLLISCALNGLCCQHSAHEMYSELADAQPKGEPRTLRRRGGGVLGRLVLAQCRLCWTITAAVFLSILVIEAVILVPSYRNYERDRVGEYARAAAAAVTAAFTVEGYPPFRSALAKSTAERLIGIAQIHAITLFDDSDTVALQIGEPIKADVAAELLGGRRSHMQMGREAIAVATALPPHEGASSIVLVATPELSRVLLDFVFRIAGLVGIIALVVTVAAMGVLRYTVLSRLVVLERSVSSAAKSPEKADLFQTATGRPDELGDLITNINALLRSVSSALSGLRRREREVLLLNTTLEQRIAARTAELENAREIAEASSRAKSNFLANMSHELRTPLNAVIGFAEMMQEEVFGPVENSRYKGYVLDIVRSGRHLLGIVDDILDLSRVEAEQMPIADGIVDLEEVLEEAVRIVEPVAAPREIRISIESSLPGAHVRGDAGRLRQVVLNLIGNSIKFTPRRGWVRIGIVANVEGSVGIRVMDNGIGIAEANLDMVMQPFGQVAPAMARNHQGAGLGLPLSKRLLELHGGRLELQSRIGSGTIVTAWLPSSRRLDVASA